ncbi:hypothetical protein EI94DRAFT_921042 [Lactarius quietus]|nr:hypothetical protein EI94DRAFT_1322726 [Lactarius quietus]KAF8260255.1 hypothetical protein EI94DRAFT_921042 [Lactarius quietus]
MPDPGEDAGAPIIVPRTGQILRQSARIKIRKPGQTGEGAHRCNATRRGADAMRDSPPPCPIHVLRAISLPATITTPSHLAVCGFSATTVSMGRPVSSAQSRSAEAFIF